VTPAVLAAEVAELAVDDLSSFVGALPRVAFIVLCSLAEERVWLERSTRLTPPPAPIVVTAPANLDEVLTAAEAAHALKMSLDTLYAKVHRGELLPEPRPPGGRLKFRRANLRLTSVADEIDRRYSTPHDTANGASSAPPARLDPTRARRGPQRDADDRRPLGARRARRHAARRNDPWAPGQGAWADPQGDPRPKGH